MNHFLSRFSLGLQACTFLLLLQPACAQTCTPLTTMPDGVFILPQPYLEGLPGSGIQDTACVGIPFSTVFQIRVPANLVIPPSLTFPIVNMSMATQGAWLNLPAGFNYSCNPPNCVFLPEQNSCIEVFGVAGSGTEGEHDLYFTVTFSTNVGQVPNTLPDQDMLEGNYLLRVRPANDPACITTALTETAPTAADLYPNPTTGLVRFAAMNTHHVRVFNSMGKLVHADPQPRGSIDLTDLPAGMYVVHYTHNAHTYSTTVHKE